MSTKVDYGGECVKSLTWLYHNVNAFVQATVTTVINFTEAIPLCDIISIYIYIYIYIYVIFTSHTTKGVVTPASPKKIPSQYSE